MISRRHILGIGGGFLAGLAVMLLVVTVVSFLIFVYSNAYMEHDHGFYRFFTWLSLFVFALSGVLLATYLTLRARASYLDVTAEQASAKESFDNYDQAARAAGVTIIPAAGFTAG